MAAGKDVTSQGACENIDKVGDAGCDSGKIHQYDDDLYWSPPEGVKIIIVEDNSYKGDGRGVPTHIDLCSLGLHSTAQSENHTDESTCLFPLLSRIMDTVAQESKNIWRHVDKFVQKKTGLLPQRRDLVQCGQKDDAAQTVFDTIDKKCSIFVNAIGQRCLQDRAVWNPDNLASLMFPRVCQRICQESLDHTLLRDEAFDIHGGIKSFQNVDLREGIPVFLQPKNVAETMRWYIETLVRQRLVLRFGSWMTKRLPPLLYSFFDPTGGALTDRELELQRSAYWAMPGSVNLVVDDQTTNDCVLEEDGTVSQQMIEVLVDRSVASFANDLDWVFGVSKNPEVLVSLPQVHMAFNPEGLPITWGLNNTMDATPLAQWIMALSVAAEKWYYHRRDAPRCIPLGTLTPITIDVKWSSAEFNILTWASPGMLEVEGWARTEANMSTRPFKKSSGIIKIPMPVPEDKKAPQNLLPHQVAAFNIGLGESASLKLEARTFRWGCDMGIELKISCTFYSWATIAMSRSFSFAFVFDGDEGFAVKVLTWH